MHLHVSVTICFHDMHWGKAELLQAQHAPSADVIIFGELSAFLFGKKSATPCDKERSSAQP